MAEIPARIGYAEGVAGGEEIKKVVEKIWKN
jgi:hypothetical protein